MYVIKPTIFVFIDGYINFFNKIFYHKDIQNFIRIYRFIGYFRSELGIFALDKPTLHIYVNLYASTRRAWEDTKRFFRAGIGTIGCRKNSERLENYVCGTVYNLSDFKFKISPQNHL